MQQQQTASAFMDRFSPETREVIVWARQSVCAYKHTHITPEHMLLGMLESKDSAVFQLLRLAKATPEQIIILVQRHLRPGEFEIPPDQLTFSERAKRVIETAKEEAFRAKQHLVGPEHLLLGLARVKNTVAGAVLAAVDLDPEQMRQAI